jgi:hypothetical protein
MLERLLGEPCYHMAELYQQPDVDGPLWVAALNGDLESLDQVLNGWAAAVDWPASIFWKELADRHPDSIVVLSHRESSAEWWRSADQTVWHVMREIKAGNAPEHVSGLHGLMRNWAGFDEDLSEQQARTRYDEHYAEVVATVPEDRLVLWHPSDGWAPLCERLGIPEPDEDPAHANTSTEFRARFDQPR